MSYRDIQIDPILKHLLIYVYKKELDLKSLIINVLELDIKS